MALALRKKLFGNVLGKLSDLVILLFEERQLGLVRHRRACFAAPELFLHFAP
jgi:hypothetical protein